MTRKNAARNALVTSIIAMLLCVSMLVGTTFAWFTDSVSSDLNTIKAGKLDVELYHGKSAPKDKVASGTKVFTDFDGNEIALWEPGTIAYTNLKVANDGNLALNYQLLLNFKNEKRITIGETSYGLYDVLKVAVFPGGFNGTREEVYNYTNFQSLSSFVRSGMLTAGNSHTYGIVICWVPDTDYTDGNTDNLYNMNNGITEELYIELGVSLFATQAVTETDSYDDSYDDSDVDVNLEMPEWHAEVTSAQALVEALEAGKTAKLMADIVLDQSVVIGAGVTAAIDLNGFKLTLVPVTSTFGLRNAAPGALINILGNLLITDSASGGQIIISNGATGIAVNDSAALQMNSGALYVSSAESTGIQASGSANVIVNNGTISGAGTAIDVVAGETVGKANIKIGASATVSNIKVADGADLKVTYYGNEAPTVNGADNVLHKGTAFDGIYQEGAKHYYIDSKTGLLNLNSFLATLMPGEGNVITVDLRTDVDLSGVAWEPIKSMWVVFDGQNHKISNLNAGMAADGRRSGFWGYAGGVTIMNLTLENATVSGSQAGIFVASADGTTITNCYLKGANKVIYQAGIEDYCGIGAISGVLIKSNINVEILEGATVALMKDGFTTNENCAFFDNLTGYLGKNSGTVTNNGSVTVTTTTEDGLVLSTNGMDSSEVTLVLVPESYEGDTVNVPEGVTAIGNYAFAYNSKVETVNLPTTVTDLGRGFDSSTVKKVVLNEGLETISPRAFKSTSALEEVVIPSTVTTIADDAFQKTGLKTITIPATVEYVGAQAFGTSKIETVIFEGDITIQNKAFRGCENLRTVYINGDDITFENTTGEANCWFCNSESNNPNTSNITFYVANETVASRVKTAMGAEAGNTPVYINGKLFDPDATNTAEIDQLKTKLAAAQSGETVEYALTHDAYIDSMIKVPNGVTLVLNGNGHQAIVNTAYPFYVNNANIQMNDLTITGKATIAIFTKGATWDYSGNNATVKASFNNVTVDLDKADNYPVVFNGIGEITMTDCTITGAGLPKEGDYRNGTHIFAGAEINLTVNGGTIGGVLMNANNVHNSTLTISGGAVIDTLILATEQTKTATLTNNGGTVNKLIQQVKDATKLVNALQGADANTVIDATGVTMTGTTGLNINGATVIGATFSNVGGQAVSGTINGTFKDCTFEGDETLRWCYTTAGTTSVFENCVINTTNRGFHFDEMNGDVIFKNCEINGFNAYSGSGTITFEGCTFGNDKANFNGLNIYTNTNLINCTFNYVSGKTNFIDMEGTGKTLTITNCTATLDGAEANVADFVGGSQLANNTVIYN